METSANFVGVRKRKWGKWVSEIRQPGKKTRIWLGSFETPEMAAVAHDVAAFWLKGQSARLNFPESVRHFPRPASLDPSDVRSAAMEAALEVKLRQSEISDSGPALERTGSGSWAGLGLYGDEWGMESPKMWRELAEAMLIAPPEFCCDFSDVDQVSEYGSLWEQL